MNNSFSNQINYEQSSVFPSLLDERYQEEQLFIQHLSQGNLSACIEYYHKGRADMLNGTQIDIYSRHQNPLRSQKNALIVLNTICRIAAQKGGVIPFVLNNISLRYSLMIENAESHDFLTNKVWPFMIVDYCQTVKDYSNTHYSPIINKVVNHILNNLPSALSVNMLAEIFFANPSTLSHKFKKETGFSITEFINQQRVRLAQFYLEQGHTSITEVAFLVGYTDSNYFCRVFKKITAVTPSTYIYQLNTRETIY